MLRGVQIVLDSRVLHCSSPNLSRHWRRAWMPQFSKTPITDSVSGLTVALAVPLLREDVSLSNSLPDKMTEVSGHTQTHAFTSGRLCSPQQLCT